MFFGEMAGGHGENSGPGPSFSFLETVKRSLWGIWGGRGPERGWAWQGGPTEALKENVLKTGPTAVANSYKLAVDTNKW